MNYDLHRTVGFFINRTHAMMKNNLKKLFKQHDITHEQWIILSCLKDNDGCIQKELAEKIDKDKAAITRLVDALEKRKLIKRECNANDRRVFLVYLTEEGRNIQEKLAPLSEVSSNQALKGLSEEETKQLKLLLIKILSNLHEGEGKNGDR
ncbi:MarR family winged helix-turn-helix transcriptional regulator [Clostridium estertheticum]|uniref:MarR family transcriptional regulator n=1 Tax=Clostridium estertheticum TaxID=238834 RepID=A0AA47I4T9_9CLOT|nr:MarR family transcriptional regulator [Clostridium estertheticum]MBU3156501.1 MarR family transcriptional regulator [Clostridium estertheticum]WAG58958.1 MarR family transcriptional regulator [Clostridium estertheticum]